MEGWKGGEMDRNEKEILYNEFLAADSTRRVQVALPREQVFV